MNGWTGKIIRVNLTNEIIKTEPLNMQDAKLYLGGRGLGSKLYRNEVDPKVDAFSPENKMIFMTGPLTGTLAPCAGRYEVITKAPMTGSIGACSSGGHFGPELKFAGYDGIIFEGKANKPVYLYINDDHFELRDASHLWGKNVSVTTDEVQKETKEDAKVACIGPAGENLVLFATIINDKNRAAGRSGFGAVMGSKNLKAIAVRGTKSIKVANKREFLNSCIDARNKMKANPATGSGLPGDGTQVLINMLNQAGAHPTRVWQQSYYEKADNINGETLTKKFPVRNTGCFGCSIGCGRVTKGEKSQFANDSNGSEYEAGWSFGSDCGINDMETICGANFLCNELCMDTITMGSTLTCAMELYENGNTANEDIGMDFPLSSSDAIVELTSFEYATSNRGDSQAPGKSAMTDGAVKEEKAATLKTFQDFTAVLDSLGICIFTTFAIGLPEIAAMLRTCTGLDYTDEEVLQIGERIWNLEKIFKLKNGFTKKDDILPLRLLKGLANEDSAQGKVDDFSKTLSEYYSIRGWNEEGVPTKAKKEELLID